jgi:sec-independent protein translocase protein TatC
VSTKRRTQGPGEPSLASMSLVEHLTELRTRLIRCIAAVFVGSVAMWFLYPYAIDWMSDVLLSVCTDEQLCQVVQTAPLQGFSAALRFAGYGGVALAMPVILWQVWRFVAPGMYPRERRLALPFVVSGTLLFAMGALIALWTLPRALEWLVRVGGAELGQLWTPTSYLDLTVKMMLAFGIGFEFPIALVFAQLLGLVSPARLGSVRRYAYVGIIALVAVLTPSGDPISLAVLSVPMILFYEGAILFGRLVDRRRRRAVLARMQR